MTDKLNQVVRWVRSLDVRTVLIAALIVVSTGHVGRLFADREDVRQAFVGYILAVCLDGVLAVSLYEAANVRKRSHRTFALCTFVLSCAVSGGFNVAYYRQNYPADPWEVSILLGVTAPLMAALVSVLKSFGEVERTEAERSLKLERFAIEQAEQTKRTEIEQKERTKRERAKARAEKARTDAIAQTSVQVSERGNGHKSNGNGRRAPGELDALARVIIADEPGIGPRPLASMLDCSPSTAAGILKRLEV